MYNKEETSCTILGVCVGYALAGLFRDLKFKGIRYHVYWPFSLLVEILVIVSSV
jgi:hypothetical protein